VDRCKNKELNITNPEPFDGKTNEKVFFNEIERKQRYKYPENLKDEKEKLHQA